MRVIIRTSKWAIWSRRFASFALPLSVLSVWSHRAQLLNSDTFQIVLASAIVLAVFAILFGFAAYVRIWGTGDHGWGRASLGILIGMICLSPFVYGAVIGGRYPLINDISTNRENPLELLVKQGEESQTNDRELLTQIKAIFPDAVTRFYPLTPSQTYTQVEQLIAGREWDVRVRRAPGIGQDGQINAMAMTSMGWRDEVVVRVTQTSEGAQVDMRSSSLNGVGDLGKNGLRIESFLHDLDAEMAKVE